MTDTKKNFNNHGLPQEVVEQAKEFGKKKGLKVVPVTCRENGTPPWKRETHPDEKTILIHV